MDRLSNLLSVIWVLMASSLVLLPSLCEAHALQPVQMTLELFCGNDMLWCGRKDVGLNLAGDLLVLNGGQKLGEDRSERGAGLDEVGAPFPSQGQTMRNKPGETGAKATHEPEVSSAELDPEYVHAAIFNFVTWIVLPLLYGFWPNDEVEGRAPRCQKDKRRRLLARPSRTTG